MLNRSLLLIILLYQVSFIYSYGDIKSHTCTAYVDRIPPIHINNNGDRCTDSSSRSQTAKPSVIKQLWDGKSITWGKFYSYLSRNQIIAIDILLLVGIIFIVITTLVVGKKKELAQALKNDGKKNNIIHNINHEIRTPLNLIVGFANIMAGELSDKGEYKTYAQYIKENSASLLSVINNLVDWTLIETSNIPDLKREKINLSSLCEECIHEIEKEGKVLPKVELYAHGTPKDFSIYSYKICLKKILMNLLDNSAKYTFEGSISVSYTVNEDKSQVIFSVTDTGIGIGHENYDRVFNSFEKENDFEQGLGLGLTICRELVHRLGGEISIGKDYKNGVCFLFTVDIKPYII